MPAAADLYYFNYKGEDYQKPPVVLIHGAGGSHLYWPAEIRRLNPYRILAPDLPGHGKSKGRGLQSVNAYAASMVKWLDALNLPRAVFVGHSLGSAIALRIALDFPEIVLGLGLLDAGVRLRVHPDILENLSSERTYRLAIETIISLAFSPHAPERLVELAAQRMSETRPTVLHGDFLACDTFDVMERVSEITQPTLVICGSDDRLTPPRYSQFLADRIPGARLRIIPNAGHMVMLEQPQAVAEELITFIAKIPYG
jgi:pimeloyl-ACP methyl ester carboxylesterase